MNQKNFDLFEADIYDYFYTIEKNREKNTLTTIFIETIKIVASIFVTFVISLISEKLKMSEIDVTVIMTISFVTIYAILQFVTFSSKQIYNMLYNKRSRVEVIKINELLFHKISTNYMNKAISVVNDIEKGDLDQDTSINCIEIALKCFEKSKNVFNEIFPDEESNKHGKREKANAIYLAHIGYPEIKLFVEIFQEELKKFLILATPITDKYNNEILELLTFFQTKLPRIISLENIFNELK